MITDCRLQVNTKMKGVYKMNTEEFTLKGTLKTGTSQKGNEYVYLDLQFDKDYSKRVFLDQAEIILLKKSATKTSPFGKQLTYGLIAICYKKE